MCCSSYYPRSKIQDVNAEFTRSLDLGRLCTAVSVKKPLGFIDSAHSLLGVGLVWFGWISPDSTQFGQKCCKPSAKTANQCPSLRNATCKPHVRTDQNGSSRPVSMFERARLPLETPLLPPSARNVRSLVRRPKITYHPSQRFIATSPGISSVKLKQEPANSKGNIKNSSVNALLDLDRYPHVTRLSPENSAGMTPFQLHSRASRKCSGQGPSLLTTGLQPSLVFSIDLPCGSGPKHCSRLKYRSCIAALSGHCIALHCVILEQLFCPQGQSLPWR